MGSLEFYYTPGYFVLAAGDTLPDLLPTSFSLAADMEEIYFSISSVKWSGLCASLSPLAIHRFD